MIRAARPVFGVLSALALLGLATPGVVRAQIDNPWVEEIAPDEEVDLDADEDPPPDETDTDPAGELEGAPTSDGAPEPPNPLDVEEDPVPPRPEPNVEREAAEPARAPWRDEIEVRQGSWAGLLERWDARLAAQKSGDGARIKRATALLEEGLRDHGVQGQGGGAQSIDLGIALVIEARRALAAGNPEAALELASLAVAVAPDLPAAHVALAEVRLKAGQDLFAAGRALVDAAAAIARTPSLLALVSAQGLSAALAAWAVVLLFVAVVLLARAFRYLVFDLHNALPRGAARWQLLTLTVLLALVPVVLGAGPVLSSLWWLTLSWAYLSRRERLTVGALGALAIALPFLVEVASVLWATPTSPAMVANRALVDVKAEAARARLRERPLATLSVVERAALAAADKREGRLEEAYEAWRRLVQENVDAGWAHNNLGVVAALLGREAHALAEFEAAREKDPALLEPIFNISLLHLRNSRNAQGAKLADELAAKDAAALERFRTLTFKRPDQAISHNRAFVDAPIPQTPAWRALLEPSPRAAEMAGEVASTLYFGLPAPVAAAAFAVFLLLWGALARVAPRLQPSHACVRCGSAASRRYDAPEVPPEMCSACYHVFVAPGARIEAGMKLRKERQVASHHRARRRWARGLSAVWPGLGHLYGGAPVRGLAFALPFGLVLFALAFVLGPIPWPGLPGPGSFVVAAPLVVVALILWLVALRNAANHVP